MKSEILKELIKNITKGDIFEITSLQEEMESLPENKNMGTYKLKIELQVGLDGAQKLFG